MSGGGSFSGDAFSSDSFSVDPSQLSGGFVDYGTVAERRSAKERAAAARAKAEQIVEQVALRQSESPSLDETQRIEELSRELALQGIEWETQYLASLNAQREAFITAEIGRRIRQARDNNNLMILLALASN